MGSVRGLVWFGLVWFGLVWFGLSGLGLFGLVRGANQLALWGLDLDSDLGFFMCVLLQMKLTRNLQIRVWGISFCVFFLGALLPLRRGRLGN